MCRNIRIKFLSWRYMYAVETDRQTDRNRLKQTETETDRQRDRQTLKQRQKQTERQTDRHTTVSRLG